MSNRLPILRLAHTDEDRAAAFRLRYEIYVEGMGLHIENADHKRRWIKEDHDDHSWIVLATSSRPNPATSSMPAATTLARSTC